jgi:hypothetical protein
MVLFFWIFLITFLSAIIIVLLSYIEWARANMPWLTSLYVYVIMGSLIGISIVVGGYYLATALIPDASHIDVGFKFPIYINLHEQDPMGFLLDHTHLFLH